MPAPESATYHADAKVAANQSFADLVDSGSGAGFIRIRTSADVLLGQVPLDDPCGTVNGTTGQLTFDIAGPDTSADASGTAAYGEICDSNERVLLALPAQAGGAPVAGKLVLNTLTVLIGGPIEILSATIG